jgi:CRP-like cAMP-binding protein
MHTIYNLHNFIDQLPEPILSKWIELSIERVYQNEECIYHQGDESTEVYQICSGSIRLCNYSEEGKEMVVASFKTGDCFGEMGLIDLLPRSSHAIAVGEVRLRILSKKHFQKMYDIHPEIAKQINLMLVHRVRLLWQYTEDASTLNLHQRLARTLMRLKHSHGQEEDNNYYISTSHEELGRMLGASRQSISKELKSLEKEGCIEVQYGKICILDLAALNASYENLMGQEQLTPVYKD